MNDFKRRTRLEYLSGALEEEIGRNPNNDEAIRLLHIITGSLKGGNNLNDMTRLESQVKSAVSIDTELTNSSSEAEASQDRDGEER